MRKIKSYLALLTVVCLLFSSCSKEDDAVLGDDPANKGTISFGAFLNDFVSNKAAFKQAVNDIPQCSDEAPAFVEVVLTQGDAPVVGSVSEPLRISVNPNPQDYDEDGVAEYFTDESASLELEPGTYTLEYFTVLDADGDVIWVAPINPGDFASFVDTPLPMNIDLGAGVKKYVDVEVVCFDDRDVNEYGYLFFDIEQYEAFEFCFFANYCPPEGRHYPAALSVNIWIGDDSTGVLLYGDETNDTGFNDNDEAFARPICFALPDLAEYADDEDYFYYEVSLLDWEGAYGDAEPTVISGTLSRADIIANFDGEDRVDYEHLRFGCDDATPGGDCPENDVDCDGIPNEDDSCPGFDDSIDADEDGVADECDECPGFDDSADSDEDGIPDGCEEDNGEDCPNDDDCDGIPNDDDDCPNDASNTCDDDDDDDDGDDDGDDDYENEEGCETAFMVGNESFFDMDFNNNRWGWGHLWNAENSSDTFEFWAAAAKNDLSKGTHVGNVTIDVDGDDVTVTFNMFEGYGLELAHIYLDGDEPTTNAPGQYTYQGDELSFQLDVDDYEVGEDFWIIVHGEVCGTEFEED